MLKKFYGVPGKIETVMVIKCGKSDVIINFKGGSIMDFANKPATYSTDNPAYQAIIENSPQFKRGEIKLLNTINVGDDTHADNNATNIKSYTDITKTQDAKEILHNEYGQDVSAIRSKADVQAAAKTLNIAFPNL